ncbi:MAG: FixH family protein [Rhodospirillaceae bacterium]|nr:FixH family protein [Rhodospirillaceae bacterium]
MELDLGRQSAKAVGMRHSYWIPGIFVGAMLLVIAVNGVMVYFATSTFPGLDTDKAYVHGLAYNETLQEAAASAALGWQANLTVARGAGMDQVTVDVIDQSGQPVSGLHLVGDLLRTTTTALDQHVTFSAVVDHAGRYRADIDLPARGLWEVRLAGTATPGGIVWQWNDRIMVP